MHHIHVSIPFIGTSKLALVQYIPFQNIKKKVLKLALSWSAFNSVKTINDTAHFFYSATNTFLYFRRHFTKTVGTFSVELRW